MPNLLQTLTARRNGVSSRFTLGQLAEQMNFGGQTYPLFTYGAATPGGEKATDNFAGLVAGAYRTNGVVWACILNRLLVFTEARFQWQRLVQGRPSDLFGTAELDLLEHPWPGGTTGDLLARMEQDVSICGNAFVLRRRDRLVRLRPDWVTVYIGSSEGYDDPNADPDAEVGGYFYAPPQADPVMFAADEVAHYAPIPDPIAKWRGMSWITPVLREVDSDSAANDHKLQFFNHAATPNLVVSFDATVTAEKARQFSELWREQHEGAWNAYKTGFLGGGATIAPVGNTFEQMAFKATQGAGETRIAAAAGVPPVIVGLSEGLQAATYSNYGQARRRFADATIRPLWRNAAGSLAKILAGPTGARLWYDDRDIPFLREDAADLATIRQTDAQTIRNLVDAGYDPDAAVAAVTADDMTLLTGKHSGLYSVQLQPPTTTTPEVSPNGTPAAN